MSEAGDPGAGQAPRRQTVDEVLRPPVERRLRRLPRLFLRALLLAWRAAPRQVAVAGATQLVAGAALAAQLLFGRRVLSLILRPGGGARFGAVAPDLAVLVGATALGSIAGLVRAEEQRLITERVARYAAGQVLEVSEAVELLAFERPEFSDRLQRAQLNAQLRPVQVATGLLGILGGLFAAAGIATALLVIDPVFLAIIFVAYLPTWFAANRATRLLYRFAVRQTEPDRRRTYLFALLTRREEAAEVRSFGLGRFLRGGYDRMYDERITALSDVVRRRLVLGLGGQLVTSAIAGSGLALLAWQATSGRLPVATAASAAGAMVLLGSRLGGLVSGIGQLYEASLFLEDFTSFVDALPGLVTARDSTVPAPERFDTLVVDSVTFTYPTRAEPSLRDVSIEIHAGEVVALVGENGSGKSTLAKLLAGLYPPDRGAVRWDATDLAACDPESVRQSVAVIFQDFVKYQLTARENVALGRADRVADPGAVEAAATAAGAHDFLSALEHGYDTRLGPQFLGGTDLSVGQWQRLALARAVFRDSPFVILDEPTASLDARAELRLFEGLRRVFTGKTVLLISHRFANVRSADRIYVLADGRVVEHGTHEELVAAEGLYAELYALQAASYADTP